MDVSPWFGRVDDPLLYGPEEHYLNCKNARASQSNPFRTRKVARLWWARGPSPPLRGGSLLKVAGTLRCAAAPPSKWPASRG
jgi:hypothetical protein